MTRKKETILQGKMTKEDAEVHFSEYAQADAEIRKENASMDLQFAKIREKHAEKLNAFTFKRDQAFDKLKYFATKNEGYFEKKKSMDFTNGKLGFRTGTPKLKSLKKFTWATVLQAIQKEKSLKRFIRTKVEIDKEKLLSERTKDEVDSIYKKIGVEVVQDETFYVEPKEEENA